MLSSLKTIFESRNEIIFKFTSRRSNGNDFPKHSSLPEVYAFTVDGFKVVSEGTRVQEFIKFSLKAQEFVPVFKIFYLSNAQKSSFKASLSTS